MRSIFVTLQGHLGGRLKEHLRAPSPIYDHANMTGYQTSVDNFITVGRESHNLTRMIKEAIYLRVNDPSLNRNNWKVPTVVHIG